MLMRTKCPPISIRIGAAVSFQLALFVAGMELSADTIRAAAASAELNHVSKDQGTLLASDALAETNPRRLENLVGLNAALLRRFDCSRVLVDLDKFPVSRVHSRAPPTPFPFDERLCGRTLLPRNTVPLPATCAFLS